MSSVEYNALDMLVNEHDFEKVQISFGDHFKWLDKIALYTPMWCTMAPNLHPRNKCISCIMIMISALFSIAYYIWCAYYKTYNDIIVEGMFLIKYAVNISSRYLQMYYFWRYFQYPWHTSMQEFRLNSSSHSSIVRLYKYIAIFMLILLIAVSIPWCVYFYSVGWIYTPVGLVFVYIPSYIFATIYFVICLKYGLYLRQLRNDIKVKDCNLSMKEIQKRYQLLYDDANINLYNIYLKYSMDTNLVSLILWGWLQTYIYIDSHGYGALSMMVNLIAYGVFYAIGACFVSEMYFALEKEVWKCGDKYMDKECDGRYYMYLIQYMGKYPLTVKIGRLVITKEGCFKFALVFMAVKLLAYSIQWIWE